MAEYECIDDENLVGVQISLFDEGDKNPEQPRHLEETNALSGFIEDIRQGISFLSEIKEEFLKYEKMELTPLEMQAFILHTYRHFQNFFQTYCITKDYFFYLKLVEKRKDFMNDYHKLGQVFLFYLDTFAYQKKLEFFVDDLDCLWLENFVLADPTKYKDDYSIHIVNKMLERKNGQCCTEKLKELDTNSSKESEEYKQKFMDTKGELEKFLKSTFSFPVEGEKVATAVFVKQSEMDIYSALSIAMAYLSRFVYSISPDYLVEDVWIISLENCIARYSDFHVYTPKLCLAKSMLLARVNARNSLQNVELVRNVLKK